MNVRLRYQPVPIALCCFLILVVFALWLRMVASDLRPLHSDEGVNFHFIQEIFSKGYYPYSHKNYHGPLYFYGTALCVFVFGSLEWAFRLFASASSAAIPLCLLLVWKYVHHRILLLAALSLSLSASLVFYGRYAIHESLFVFASCWFALSVFQWLISKKTSWHLHAGASLACLIATKETFIISVFCVFWSFLLTAEYMRWREGWKQESDGRQGLPGYDMLERLHLGIFYELFLQWRYIVLGLFVCVFLVCVCFSGGFQWSGGLREMFLAVPQWIDRNDSDKGHFKPFLYYLQMLLGTPSMPSIQHVFNRHVSGGAEWVHGIALFVCIPVLFRELFGKTSLFLRNNDAYFFVFVCVWSLSSFFVYSMLNYKTPWLVINISMPLCLTLACLFHLMCFLKGGVVIVVLSFLCMSYQCFYYTFYRPYGHAVTQELEQYAGPFSQRSLIKAEGVLGVHPYSYVHTSPGFLRLLADIDSYRKRTGIEQPKILVAVNQYWPLPYYQYLRELHSVSYLPGKAFSTDSFNTFDILLYPVSVDKKIQGSKKNYYRLSDVQETHTYFVYRDKKK